MVAEPNYEHPLDALVNNPIGRPPLADEDTFDRVLKGMVADSAPKLFAVVQVYGERVDARIAGWGMAFEDTSDIVGTDNSVHLGLANDGDRTRGFGFGTHIRPRLVWCEPDAASPSDDVDFKPSSNGHKP